VLTLIRYSDLNVWHKIITCVTIILLAEEDIVKGGQVGGMNLTKNSIPDDPYSML